MYTTDICLGEFDERLRSNGFRIGSLFVSGYGADAKGVIIYKHGDGTEVEYVMYYHNTNPEIRIRSDIEDRERFLENALGIWKK